MLGVKKLYQAKKNEKKKKKKQTNKLTNLRCYKIFNIYLHFVNYHVGKFSSF